MWLGARIEVLFNESEITSFEKIVWVMGLFNVNTPSARCAVECLYCCTQSECIHDIKRATIYLIKPRTHNNPLERRMRTKCTPTPGQTGVAPHIQLPSICFGKEPHRIQTVYTHETSSNTCAHHVVTRWHMLVRLLRICLRLHSCACVQHIRV